MRVCEWNFQLTKDKTNKCFCRGCREAKRTRNTRKLTVLTFNKLAFLNILALTCLLKIQIVCTRKLSYALSQLTKRTLLWFYCLNIGYSPVRPKENCTQIVSDELRVNPKHDPQWERTTTDFLSSR